MRISDWSSDVCSSDLKSAAFTRFWVFAYSDILGTTVSLCRLSMTDSFNWTNIWERSALSRFRVWNSDAVVWPPLTIWRSEEHTSELQSLMRISYAVFCLKKKKIN